MGRWQGWVAAPLNEHGQQQVERLANFIRHLGMSALYASDHRRAVQTAEILTDVLDFAPVYDNRLRERDIGRWQGLTVPEIHGWYADDYARLQADPDGFVIPGGESLEQVRDRVVDALYDIIAAAEATDDVESVGLISHTTTIRVLVDALIPGVDLSHVNFGNTSVTTVQRKNNGTWELVATNDCSHLDGIEARYMPEIQGDD